MKNATNRPRLFLGGMVFALAALAGACSSSTPSADTATTTTTAAKGGTTTTTSSGGGTGTTTSSAGVDKGAAAVAMAKKFEGTYTGTWNNKTFNSTGTVTATIKVDEAAKTLTATTTLTGNVFGAPAPGPMEIKLDLANLTDTAKFTTSLFGDVTVTVAPDLTVTMDAPSVPGTRVSSFKSTSKLGDGTMNGTYEVKLKDGTTANGTTELKKS